MRLNRLVSHLETQLTAGVRLCPQPVHVAGFEQRCDAVGEAFGLERQAAPGVGIERGARAEALRISGAVDRDGERRNADRDEGRDGEAGSRIHPRLERLHRDDAVERHLRNRRGIPELEVVTSAAAADRVAYHADALGINDGEPVREVRLDGRFHGDRVGGAGDARDLDVVEDPDAPSGGKSRCGEQREQSRA